MLSFAAFAPPSLTHRTLDWKPLAGRTRIGQRRQHSSAALWGAERGAVPADRAADAFTEFTIMRRLSAAVLFTLALAGAAAAQPAPPRVPSIAVTGSGEVELRPDLARIQAVVSTEADSAPQAAELNRAATDRVL